MPPEQGAEVATRAERAQEPAAASDGQPGGGFPKVLLVLLPLLFVGVIAAFVLAGGGDDSPTPPQEATSPTDDGVATPPKLSIAHVEELMVPGNEWTYAADRSTTKPFLDEAANISFQVKRRVLGSFRSPLGQEGFTVEERSTNAWTRQYQVVIRGDCAIAFFSAEEPSEVENSEGKPWICVGNTGQPHPYQLPDGSEVKEAWTLAGGAAVFGSGVGLLVDTVPGKSRKRTQLSLKLLSARVKGQTYGGTPPLATECIWSAHKSSLITQSRRSRMKKLSTAHELSITASDGAGRASMRASFSPDYGGGYGYTTVAIQPSSGRQQQADFAGRVQRIASFDRTDDNSLWLVAFAESAGATVLHAWRLENGTIREHHELTAPKPSVGSVERIVVVSQGGECVFQLRRRLRKRHGNDQAGVVRAAGFRPAGSSLTRVSGTLRVY